MRRWPGVGRNALFGVAMLLIALAIDASVVGLYPLALFAGAFVGVIFAALPEVSWRYASPRVSKFLITFAFVGFPLVAFVGFALFWGGELAGRTQFVISAFAVWSGLLPVGCKRALAQCGKGGG
jgi:hypothetical protein